MAPNWWLALLIMVVINGIVGWTLLTDSGTTSRRARKWFFIVGNTIGLILVIAQFIWLDL